MTGELVMTLEYADAIKAGIAKNMLQGRYIYATLDNVPKDSWTEMAVVHHLQVAEEDAAEAERVLISLGLMGSKVQPRSTH